MDVKRASVIALLTLNAAALAGTSLVVSGFANVLARELTPPYTEHLQLQQWPGVGSPRIGHAEMDHIRQDPRVDRLVMRTRSEAAVRYGRPMQLVSGVAIYRADPAFLWLAGYEMVRGRTWTDGEIAAESPFVVLSGRWSPLPTEIVVDGVVHGVAGLMHAPRVLGTAEAPSVWLPTRWTTPPVDAEILVTVRPGQSAALLADVLRSWFTQRFGHTRGNQEPVVIRDFARQRSVIQQLQRSLSQLILLLLIVPVGFAGTAVAAVTRLDIEQRLAEVGLRRALGARRQDILNQFLRESLRTARTSTICAGVCVLGIACLAHFLGLPLGISPVMLAISALLPTTTVIAFAVGPAAAAANLPPITALSLR